MSRTTTTVEKLLPLGLSILVFALGSVEAEATVFGRRYKPHHRYGEVVVLPRDATSVTVHGTHYRYYQGVFYRHGSRGVVVVPAPVGAIVSSLPPDHRTIIIDGITYHYYDGVYYKGGPAGYTVVPVYDGDAALRMAQESVESRVVAPEQTLVINVPNKNGSYTPVTLQLAVNGMYIGPEGEVYPTRPEMSQLRMMYGK